MKSGDTFYLVRDFDQKEPLTFDRMEYLDCLPEPCNVIYDTKGAFHLPEEITGMKAEEPIQPSFLIDGCDEYGVGKWPHPSLNAAFCAMVHDVITMLDSGIKGPADAAEKLISLSNAVIRGERDKYAESMLGDVCEFADTPPQIARLDDGSFVAECYGCEDADLMILGACTMQGSDKFIDTYVLPYIDTEEEMDEDEYEDY